VFPRRRRTLALGLTVAVAGALAWALLRSRGTPLPSDLRGLVVYVSDHEGADALYAVRLPDGRERRLAYTPDPAREPALSPDGTRVAFSTGGRIALCDVKSGTVSVLTLGVERRDGAPAWSPDGRSLVVASRAAAESNADLHILTLPASPEAKLERRPLTVTPGLDEREPCFAPDGAALLFTREDSIVRLDLKDGRTRRLTSGLRRAHAPTFRPDGRLLYLWSAAKQFGLDAFAPDLKEHVALSTGSAFYRRLAPSPDGRYLLATFTYDLGFHPLEALKLRPTEELHLLDEQGRPLGVLRRSRRHSYHSATWGR
jgi:Tol biopolymer transport system component